VFCREVNFAAAADCREKSLTEVSPVLQVFAVAAGIYSLSTVHPQRHRLKKTAKIESLLLLMVLPDAVAADIVQSLWWSRQG